MKGPPSPPGSFLREKTRPRIKLLTPVTKIVMPPHKWIRYSSVLRAYFTYLLSSHRTVAAAQLGVRRSFCLSSLIYQSLMTIPSTKKVQNKLDPCGRALRQLPQSAARVMSLIWIVCHSHLKTTSMRPSTIAPKRKNRSFPLGICLCSHAWLPLSRLCQPELKGL